MIIHIDFDSFFVSAHRSINNNLQNKPVIVISGSNIFDDKIIEDNQIAISISYEARKCGINTTMLVKTAKQLCNNLYIIKSEHKLYQKISKNIKEYINTQIPNIEQFSVDEFFCDTTGLKEEPILIAKRIQQEIYNKFKIPVSCGISSNKWIAKIATNVAKPFGIYEVDDNYNFIKDRNINKLTGIGKVQEKKLLNNNIKTLGDILNLDINRRISLNIEYIYARLKEDSRNTISDKKTEVKSLSKFRSFNSISDTKETIRRLAILSRLISYERFKKKLIPKGIVLSIKYQDKKVQKSSVLHKYRTKDIFTVSKKLLLKSKTNNIKGIGITLKNFENSNQFSFDENDIYKIENDINILKEKYREDIVIYANELK